MPDSEKPKIYPAPSADPAFGARDYAIQDLDERVSYALQDFRERIQKLEQEIADLRAAILPKGTSELDPAGKRRVRLDELRHLRLDDLTDEQRAEKRQIYVDLYGTAPGEPG